MAGVGGGSSYRGRENKEQGRSRWEGNQEPWFGPITLETSQVERSSRQLDNHRAQGEDGGQREESGTYEHIDGTCSQEGLEDPSKHGSVDGGTHTGPQTFQYLAT